MKQFKQGDQTTTTMSKEQTEMTFHEMFTNLFNTDFLTPDEIETICKAVELYSTAKEKAAFEAARETRWIQEVVEIDFKYTSYEDYLNFKNN